MSIVKYDPFAPARGFRNLFDDFFNRNLADFWGNDFTISTPSVNVVEQKDYYRIEVAAPGLDKADFDVSVDSGYLNISAKRENQTETKDEQYTRREFNYTSFKRSFQLPDHVNADQIGANYDKGVLTITLPKREENKASLGRTIEIK
ncbi:MAG: Hsp20/alpha crystallin family protein [Saprospiraceae bacterium]